MVDTKPLLKGFGAAAGVARQIATDKAVNSRRVRSDFTQFDITGGQLIEDYQLNPVDPGSPTKVPHKLGRVPAGAIIMKLASAGYAHCSAASETHVSIIHSQADDVVTLWVV